MTLSSTASRAAYAGNGSTTHFAVPFLFADNSHVIAILRDANGSETPLAENTHYTLTGAGDASGGTLTMITVPVDHTPQTGETLVVRRVVPLTQETDYVENDPFPAEVHERALDLAAMRDQQLDEKVERALKFPVSDSSALVAEIPNSVSRAGKIFGFDAEGDPTVSEIDLDEIDGLFDDAASAAESAAAALASQNAAATSAVAAETARAAAEAIAEGIGFDDFVQISLVNTPYMVTTADRGKMLICDTSAGAITVNMATIAVLGTPTTIGVKKKTGDGNSVTVNFGGSDTDDEGSTSRTIGSVGGLAMHADADTDPDTWVVETFGASAGNLTVDSFSGDGTETTFTLPANPGSKNNTWVFISGVYQAKDTYEISNTTLTFETAPAAGINNVQVVIGSTLPLGVPADKSVGADQLSDDDATISKLLDLTGTSIGAYKFVQLDLAGATEPPSSHFIRLLDGLTDAGEYNEGKLTSESVTGSAPLITATALIADANSPLNGQTVHLLETERRFLRPGSPGILEDDAFQGHEHNTGFDKDDSGGGGAADRGINGDRSTTAIVNKAIYGTARYSDETRPRNIGIAIYMRIK